MADNKAKTQLKMAGVLVSLTSGLPRVYYLPSVLLHYLIIVSCCCLYAASAQDSKMKCTSMSVAPLEDTTLTCHFPEDLSVTKKDFTVYHYVKGGSPDAVVDCWWVRGEVGCAVKKGFEYNKVVTTNLTVTLKGVTPAITGTYACQVAGYGPESLETCEIKLDKSCNIIYERSGRGANITCFFDEDIKATRRNFSVYKHSDLEKQGKQAVAKCYWKERQPQCWVENGYIFDRSLWIPEVTSDKEGNYSCWHVGSNTEQHEPCLLSGAVKNSLMEDTDRHADQQGNPSLAIGLSVTIVVLLTAAIVVSLRYRKKVLSLFCPRRPNDQEPPVKERHTSMRKSVVDYEMTTKMFQEYLEKEIQAMFPKILDTFYFVPPVYFNKTSFNTQLVAGQAVYVPDPADPYDVRHDQAMQHVLNCLHHMAKQYQENMFVLTQFKYDDYLNNIGNEFRKHRLPVPAGFTKENQNIQCFDLMVVHRQYGVLVGVVKAVGENVSESLNDLIVNEVTEAVHELKKGADMIKHLMSDQEQFPTVRQILILPNMARTTLKRALDNHPGLVEVMRECLGTNAVRDPTELCLCAEDVADEQSLQDPRILSGVTSRLRHSLLLADSTTKDNVPMTDELYLRVLSRFCGPATQSALEGQCQSISLPKTRIEAISTTGDLYQRVMLYPEMLALLTEEKLFLVGPPNTGKTRLLTLAGKTWRARGHDLYVVSGPSGSRDSAVWTFLNQSTQNVEGAQADIAAPGSVLKINCNFNKKKEMEDTLKHLIKKRGENVLCVLADDADSMGTHFRQFCKDLSSQCPGLPLWITSSSQKNVPEGWKVETFTRAINCPPAVVREAARAGANFVVPSCRDQTPFCLSPTDGPEVEYIYHRKGRALTIHNCTECGQMVADFLLKNFISRKDTSMATDEETMSASTPFMSGEEESATLKRSVLTCKDLLVLYEDRRQQLIDGLKLSGIQVRTLQAEARNEAFDEKMDCACVLHIDQLTTYRPRRKIVVYVEDKNSPRDPPKKWRGITSCTSQLIVMKWNP
ncbi:uncharacterized protein LOC112575160 isoform X1 [Pomacea canaliculata]|uniref:uncharacterized protein LOC112575160 isoform X1 n=2 Tax=Pomacea canaliculata TaxID=400727 RepID=UPI000D7259A1|nr:uncharacterized protein LOC112575160 isoform X1 [Pomacea canaliculata]